MGKKHGKKAAGKQFTVDIDGIRVFGPGLRVDFDGMTITVDPKKYLGAVDALTLSSLQPFIGETADMVVAYADAKAAKPDKTGDCTYKEEDVLGWIKNTLLSIANRNLGEVKGTILVTDFFDELGFGPEPDVLSEMREELGETAEPRPTENADELPETSDLTFSAPGPEPEATGDVQPDLNAIRDEILRAKPDTDHVTVYVVQGPAEAVTKALMCI